MMQTNLTNVGKRVVKKSVHRLGGYLIGAALQFVIIAWIARYLGTTGFGHYVFILAWGRLFQLVADMGVRHMIIRDIAIDHTQLNNRLGLARALLWSLSILGLSLMVILANLLHLSDDVRHATYLAGLAVMVIFHGLSYSAVLKAFEAMGWDIFGFVLHKVIFLVAIWYVSQTAYGLRGVFAAMLAANTCQWLYFRTLVRLRYGHTPCHWDMKACGSLLAEAFPLGLAEVLQRLTWEVDKFFLVLLATPLAVGLFSGAYKILESLNPLRVHLTLPLFPVFSRLAQTSNDSLFRAYARSLKSLFILSTPLAVAFWVFAEHLVTLSFGPAYREAAVVLQLLTPAVFFLLPTAIYGYMFTALGRQSHYTRCLAMGLGINLCFDLLLIPVWGDRGAAMGTSAAELFIFLYGWRLLRQLAQQPAGLGWMWRMGLAGVAMGGIFQSVHDADRWVLGVGVIGGFCAYLGLLVLLKTFNTSELAMVQDLLRLPFRPRSSSPTSTIIQPEES